MKCLESEFHAKYLQGIKVKSRKHKLVIPFQIINLFIFVHYLAKFVVLFLFAGYHNKNVPMQKINNEMNGLPHIYFFERVGCIVVDVLLNS
jgi:hypothetical protein